MLLGVSTVVVWVKIEIPCNKSRNEMCIVAWFTVDVSIKGNRRGVNTIFGKGNISYESATLFSLVLCRYRNGHRYKKTIDTMHQRSPLTKFEDKSVLCKVFLRNLTCYITLCAAIKSL